MYDNYDDPMFDDIKIKCRFAKPGSNSALHCATRRNPRIHSCPTCKRPNKLTYRDKMSGYQCDDCADRDEGLMP